MSCEAAITPEDRALLERIAARIVELHLEVPALLTLEGGKPLSLLAGQTMVFFEPIVGALLRFSDYRRFAQLIERRETFDTLIRLVEERADAVQSARRVAAAQRRAARPSDPESS
jgi:hypothetical protein